MNTTFRARLLARALGVALLLAFHGAHAEELSVGNVVKPSALFVQLGAAEHGHEGAFGATWDLPWRREFDCCLATGYVEAAVGRWSGNGEN